MDRPLGSHAVRTASCYGRWWRPGTRACLRGRNGPHGHHQGRSDALALPGGRDPDELQVVVGPVRVTAVNELTDLREARCVDSCGQLFQPPNSSATDRWRCPGCGTHPRGGRSRAGGPGAGCRVRRQGGRPKPRALLPARRAGERDRAGPRQLFPGAESLGDIVAPFGSGEVPCPSRVLAFPRSRKRQRRRLCGRRSPTVLEAAAPATGRQPLPRI
jgi:hypothetical protein